jgi:hypothetical protein
MPKPPTRMPMMAKARATLIFSHAEHIGTEPSSRCKHAFSWLSVASKARGDGSRDEGHTSSAHGDSVAT